MYGKAMVRETTRKPKKLSRQDWVTIGLQILISSGIEAVRVEPLAKLLKVSRGSFYWHFKNRNELLEAILKEWETSNTLNVIKIIESAEVKPEDKLLSLFEIAAQDDDKLEKAVRIWAMHDVNAAAVLSRVDRRRLEYLQSLFLLLNFQRKDAEICARIIYYVRIGWFMMGSPVEPMKRLLEVRLIHKILTQYDR
jgi:AcrR family transcriptional regulator